MDGSGATDTSLPFPGNAGRGQLEQLNPRETEHNAGAVWDWAWGALDLPSGRRSSLAIPVLFRGFLSGFSGWTLGMLLQLFFLGSLIALAQYSIELAMLLGI